MAGNDDGQERTYDASEKKQRDAAEKGQIVKSREINSAVILITGAAALTFAHGPMARAIGGITHWCMDVSNTKYLDLADAEELLAVSLDAVTRSLVVPLGVLVVAALLSGFAQTRFQIATKALEPKWERLNPIDGIKNQYFSWTPLVELVKGVTKIVALGTIAWWAVADRLDELPGLAMTEPGAYLQVLVDLGWTLVLSSMPLILVIAALDYAYNWWKHNEDLKMTHQEFKQEQKEQHGDPYMRQARKQRAHQIAMGNAVRQVKEADVVVTNPTHYAVALRYRSAESSAPVILSMGVDHVALKIRQEARRHDVPVIENRSLARALHANGAIGQAIPPQLFGAVARVLATVYRRRMQARR